MVVKVNRVERDMRLQLSFVTRLAYVWALSLCFGPRFRCGKNPIPSSYSWPSPTFQNGDSTAQSTFVLASPEVALSKSKLFTSREFEAGSEILILPSFEQVCAFQP